MSAPLKISYPSLQVMAPMQFVTYINPKVAHARWRVIKLKKANFRYSHYPIVVTAILWPVYGIYYAFIVYPVQFACVVLFLILGWMWSYMFDRK